MHSTQAGQARHTKARPHCRARTAARKQKLSTARSGLRRMRTSMEVDFHRPAQASSLCQHRLSRLRS
ncbi:hypothetical protein AAFF_G00248460 [Aldrovandia affinis]|uniref:Uncharacterized protein n=1 Tax=Aldrovandia affinis TaxID=143900 RepID=A0AAD7W3G1_9TELE|nr:hypothetical protein AAFF_G00248460 [Aldrovandia affinis]